jgi:hypothetical protein
MDAFTVSSSPLKLTQLQDQCMSMTNDAQIHTIMLNGQPALFIPASSSNALLCQMLMSNTAANNQPQIYQLNEIQQPQAIQLNANDLANFLVAASNSNANHVNLGLSILHFHLYLSPVKSRFDWPFTLKASITSNWPIKMERP